MKHLAGWSAVKMFERYVPEVVMQQIILEVTASAKSMAKQNRKQEQQLVPSQGRRPTQA